MKEDQNKNLPKNSSPEEGENQNTSGWKRIFKKKWFFPAVYLGAAALILALITTYQSPGFDVDSDDLGFDNVNEDSELPGEENYSLDDQASEDSHPVTGHLETMNWPVADGVSTKVVLPYFDDQATEDEQMEAMVQYQQTFHPSQGIGIAHAEGESFEVLAALSGTVINAEKEPIYGYVVEIEHDDGLVTIYQSLDNLEVASGDQVRQGEVLGHAGRNVFRKDLGVHLYFEVRENGQVVNPNSYFAQAEEEAAE